MIQWLPSITRPVVRVVAVAAVMVSLGACGASSPDLDQRLGAIDQAIVDEDYELARDEVNSLLQETAQADLEPSEEDAITSAGTALLKRIDSAQEAANEPDPEPTPEPTPSEPTPDPEPTPEVDEPDEDEKDDKKEEDKEKKEKDEKDKKKD